MGRVPKLPVGPIRRATLLQTMTAWQVSRDYTPVLNGVYVRSDQPVDYAQRSRTAYDLGRRLPLDRAVEAVDGLCNIGNCDPGGLHALIDGHRGDRGLEQLRRVVELADAGAESPWETRTRLLVVRAGFEKPETQLALVDGKGRLVAQVDMAWPRYRVVLEYDGDHHRERDRYARDIRRTNNIRRLGWDVVVATKELVLRHPDELLERVASALRAGGATDVPVTNRRG